MMIIFNTEVFLQALKFSKRILLFVFAIGSAIVAPRYLSRPINELSSYSREVFSRENQLMRLTLSGDEKYRLWTPLEKINTNYIQAVLLLEDQYFYYHPGANPFSLLKALFLYHHSDQTPGASTITMQLVRLRYRLGTKTILGKLKQIFYAIKMEAQYSKHDILEAYLNSVPLGGPIEGVGAASRIYFNKTPSDLTLSEALLLAVIPQSPTRRSLAATQNSESPALKKAKNLLLRRWVTKYPQHESKIFDVQLPLISKKIKELPFYAPHFSEMALNQSTSLSVLTTLDLRLQKLVEVKTSQFIEAKRNIGIKNASILVINHESQEVLAYVGSSDFFNKEIEGQVDGVMALRSPGSTLKPFVYALAFEQGLIHSKSVLKDAPTQFAIYEPENFDQKFLGPLSAEQALIQSRNIPAVALSQKLQKPNLFEFLKNAHIHFPRDAEYYGLSIVLGGTEISPWNLAHLYSALANRGEWFPLRWNRKDLQVKPEKILSPESSFTIMNALTKTPPLYGNYRPQWTQSSFPVAWKTGTSHAFRDAWTAGSVGPYTIVVWLGNFNNAPNPALIGRDVAAPLFFQIIDGLDHKDFVNPAWNSPVGLQLQTVNVCSLSGHLPHDFCKHQVNAWFQPGVSPISKCDIHRPFVINTLTGLRSCNSENTNTRVEIFEVWPSDLLAIYEQAGLHRQLPPGFDKDCSLSQTENSGQPPSITSPQPHVTYLRSLTNNEDLNTITFSAVSDSDAKELFWFVDQNFIGKTKANEPLNYKTRLTGDHLVTVVDNLGRSDSRKLSLQVVY